MSGTYWVYREPFSEAVQEQFLSLTEHLSNDDKNQLTAKIEEHLGTYIQLKKIENDVPKVAEQKKSIDQVYELFMKFRKSLMLLDQRTLDTISLNYQEEDIDKWLKLKTIEHEKLTDSLDIIEDYVDLLRNGKEQAYKGVTKNKDNPRLYFVKCVQKELNNYNINTPASTNSPFHYLIKLLLEQNNEFISEVAEVKKINQG